MTANDRIPITDLAPKISEMTKSPPPRHSDVWRACVDGRIPAAKTRGRWTVQASDLPEIARAFGLDPHAVAA